MKFQTIVSMPDLACQLADAAPSSCCAKLRPASCGLSAAFKATFFAEKALREQVGNVLAENSPSLKALQGARAVMWYLLRVTELNKACAQLMPLLARLRKWLPIVFPPSRCIAQAAAVECGIVKSSVAAIAHFCSHDRHISRELVEILRRCCVHNEPGALAAADAGAAGVLISLLQGTPCGCRSRTAAVAALQAISEFHPGASSVHRTRRHFKELLVQAGAISVLATTMVEDETPELLAACNRLLFCLSDTSFIATDLQDFHAQLRAARELLVSQGRISEEFGAAIDRSFWARALPEAAIR
mmetsp:Transcript_25363/g.45958  ORF Transcript_25363/g.45958 Transcript_25363/m.45958 type:complete len:301 (+) Transcript_25363:64-966(+)